MKKLMPRYLTKLSLLNNRRVRRALKTCLLISALVVGTPRLSAQKTDLQNLEEALIGEHMFGVQFIWDGYGTAEITRNAQGELVLIGEQYSSNKEEFVLLEGKIVVINDRTFKLIGHLKLFTEGCCGLLDRDITYTFRKTGSRAYWRLKERDDLCSSDACAYYMDIFE